MRLRTLGVALLVACLTMPAAAQESITRAEELIRLQEVPLAMPVSFERAYSPEQVDFLAWIATRALDPTTSAWNPRHRAWALYRANVRYTVEQSLRRRWADAAGVVRSRSPGSTPTPSRRRNSTRPSPSTAARQAGRSCPTSANSGECTTPA
jgi:hypothetical protein